MIKNLKEIFKKCVEIMSYYQLMYSSLYLLFAVLDKISSKKHSK